MKACEYYKIPWAMNGAVIVNRATAHEDAIEKIDWRKHQVDLRSGKRIDIMDLVRGWEPCFSQETGEQLTGITKGERLKSNVLSLGLSTRAEHVIERLAEEDGLKSYTLGEFLQRVSMARLRGAKGCGAGVCGEILGELQKIGFAMRPDDEDDGGEKGDD